MSIEGGLFECFMHNFVTGNVKKWDKHCFETEGHTVDVEQQCKKCGHWNRETDLSYPERFVERSHSNKPEDNPVIVLKCKKCEV